MRTRALALLLAALALSAPAAALAQDNPRAVQARRLPPGVAERVIDFFNAPTTAHFTGEARIAAQSTVQGDVAVLDGVLTVAGRVEGDVVVVNGDVEFLEGSAVTGDVTVVGGEIRGEGRARVGGEMVAYSERLDYVRRGERIYAERDRRREAERAEARREEVEEAEEAEEEAQDEAMEAAEDAEMPSDEEWDGDEEGWTVERSGRRGRADFVVTTGNGYNRVEGLPITFGPFFETPGRNPFRLRVNGIFRTESGPGFGPEQWGFHARAEQFLGGRRELRVGGTAFHTVEPIEDWHLSKLENGLATFFLHRDYRDHYHREGGSVYFRVDPQDSPFSSTVELRLEKHRAVEAGSPWSLFDNDEPWRLQPLAAAGDLRTVAVTTRLDTRNDRVEPSTGWYVQGTVEHALRSTLGGATAALLPDDDTGGPPAVFTQPEYGQFTRGLIDIRRYNRISASSRLNLRLVAGGALDDTPLPPQRQHALGGEGSLPGFSFFSQDCGARSRVVDPGGSPDGSRFYAAYGCDRFVLAQAEYRGDLSFRVDWDDYGRRDGDEGEDEWEDDDDGFRGWDADLSWVLFADVGRGWSLDPELFDEETAADVGFGVLLGRLGIYLAVPVTDGADGVNFFIRLNPRI
jgi:cytoskeletal protein CcmA (bactofilin family)